MIANQLNLLMSLLKRDSLQKTLRVVSLIDCTIKEDNIFLRKLVENMRFKNEEVIVFKDNENDNNDLKSITIVNNNIKYLFGQNIFSEDIFKSKYNQEILRTSSVMNDGEFKDLNFIIIDATNIFKKFISKILKISDNILILADTSEESFKKIVSNFHDEKLCGEKIDVVLINNNEDLDWQKYFENFKKNVKNICKIDVKILDLILKEFSNIELYKTGEKIYLSSMTKEDGKNSNFFDFILNILN